MEENKRVLLGMSGGTDSSVAAMRLLEAGYEVTVYRRSVIMMHGKGRILYRKL